MKLWPKAPLKSVARVIRGVTYEKGDVLNSHSPRDIPIIRAGNISEEINTNSDLVWLPRSAVQDDQLLSVGDVVMCMSSGSASLVGKSARLKAEWLGSFGAFCSAIRTDPSQATPEFIAQVLAARAFRDFAGAAQGNGIKNLKKSALENFLIPLPPLAEQRRVAGLLDRAADIKRRADAAHFKARSIIPALFFETFGDPITMRERFPVRALGEVIKDRQLGLVRSTREQPEDGAFGYVRMNAVTTDGRVVLNDLRRANASPSEARVNELRPGDLLFNTRNSRELVGKMGLYRGGPGNLFNNNLMRIRLVADVRAEYINSYFQCPEGRGAIEEIKKGTTSVCAVYYKDLARVPVPIPPLDLQTAFAEGASRLEVVANQLDAAAAKAEAMANALSAEVFG